MKSVVHLFDSEDDQNIRFFIDDKMSGVTVSFSTGDEYSYLCVDAQLLKAFCSEAVKHLNHVKASKGNNVGAIITGKTTS